MPVLNLSKLESKMKVKVQSVLDFRSIDICGFEYLRFVYEQPNLWDKNPNLEITFTRTNIICM